MFHRCTVQPVQGSYFHADHLKLIRHAITLTFVGGINLERPHLCGHSEVNADRVGAGRRRRALTDDVGRSGAGGDGVGHAASEGGGGLGGGGGGGSVSGRGRSGKERPDPAVPPQ